MTPVSFGQRTKNSIPKMQKLIKKIYHNLHWYITGFLIVYALLPFISPILFRLGLEQPAWWIQSVYRFLCHQRGERSFYLFGSAATHSVEELHTHGYNLYYSGYPFIGNSEIGYKVAFCVRDTFIYWTMAITGIVVSASKMRVHVKWWILVLLTFPMIIDGTVQFFSELVFLTQNFWHVNLANPYYLSNNLTRAITGTMFGLGAGVFLLSELKAAVTNDNR